jgi:hypothetical protein
MLTVTLTTRGLAELLTAVAAWPAMPGLYGKLSADSRSQAMAAVVDAIEMMGDGETARGEVTTHAARILSGEDY